MLTTMQRQVFAVSWHKNVQRLVCTTMKVPCVVYCWFFLSEFNLAHAEIAAPLAVNVSSESKHKAFAQSSSVIPQRDMSYIRAGRIEDVADYLPGVQLGRFQAGIGSDLYVRGFSLGGQFFVDGLLDKQGYFIRDPATVEQTTVLMGADSARFGSSSPGGVINYQTKQPHFEAVKMLSVETGSPAQARLTYDATGQLAVDSDWAYRTILVHQQAETGQKQVGDGRLVLFPSLLYQTDTARLLLEAEFNRQDREYDFDHVFVRGAPVYNVSYVDPRTEAQRDSLRLSSHYSRQQDDGWRLDLDAGWVGMERYDRIVGFSYLAAEDQPLPGYYRLINEASGQYHLKAAVERSWKTQGIKNTLRLGMESRGTDSDVMSVECEGCFQLDIFNPTFNYPLPTAAQLTADNYRTVAQETGLSLHHRLQVGNTDIAVGLRHTHLTGSRIATDSGSVSGEIETWGHPVSLGISHSLGENWRVFANRNESLLSNAGYDRNKKLLPPREGVQHELGVSYQRPGINGKPIKMSASIYQVKQNNLTVRDPLDRSARMLSGSATVKGVESKLELPITPALRAEAAYNYGHATLTRDASVTRLHNIPQHSGSLKLEYQPDGRTDLFLGAVYVDKRPGDDANSFEVPAYTRLDAGLAHKLTPKVTLKAGVRNLLDEDYVASSSAADFIVQGRKRTVTVGIEMDF